MDFREEMEDAIEIAARWHGPVTLQRVADGDFTDAMSEAAVGMHLWGAARGDEFRSLYIGRALNPIERQFGPRGHLEQKRDLFRRVREQRWDVLFWTGYLEFARRPRSEREIEVAMDVVEKALIYRVKPEWNRSDSGYVRLPVGVVLDSINRRPPSVPRVVRLKAGTHA